MTTRARWGTTALLLALGSGWACAHGPRPDGTARGPARADAPERVACGLTGLQTGRGRGFIVHADGRVQAWAGRTAGEGVEPRGVALAEGVGALWASVRAADLFARDDQAVGTTAAFVQVDAAARSHRVSWAVGPGAPEVDSTLTRVFDLCQRVGGAAR